MIREVRIDGIERVLKEKDGVHLDEFLLNPELTKLFRRGGLYMISVNIPAFDNYIKIGLSSNLVARLSGHRTSLYPVSAHIRVPCLAIKRTDLNPDEGETKKAKVSFMYKAEQHVKKYLSKNNFVPKGDWYKIHIPDLLRIMLNEHFGDEATQIRADGFKCLFYVLNNQKCFEIKKAIWDEIKTEERTRSARVKNTETIQDVVDKRKPGGSCRSGPGDRTERRG